MNMSYRLAAFDRQTERLIGYQALPPSLVVEIREIAGIPADDDGLGDYPLDTEQVRQIAKKLAIEVQPSLVEYFIEPFEAMDAEPESSVEGG